MDMNTHHKGLIRQFGEEEKGLPVNLFLGAVAAVVIIGALIGFVAAKVKGPASPTAATGQKVQTDKAAGIADKKTFKDSAEGVLKEGGIDGEGNFHLERPGGVSQNVYLTSTTVDLAQYVGKKVKVHGETFNSQKAGWLMDVGLVEVQ